MESEPRRTDRDEPVSLAPLDPEEALRALLTVKPGQLDERQPDAPSGQGGD